MSLAHLMPPKLPRTRTAGAAADRAAKAGAGVTAYCGASREPIYRSLNEATESGLEVCGTCLSESRKPRPRPSAG